MAAPSLPNVLQEVRKLAAVRTGRALSDRELLERFAAANDESAFTVLVERHGPMVLGACRRALGNTHDAEDACQATFLVLARKATSVTKGAAMGGWLHQVACSVAANLRRERARRGRRERQAPSAAPRDPAAEVSWREVQAALDEEIQALPACYRDALILCYLDGQTRDEAARQLGVSLGALHGRLERGRNLLRDRLTRRGLSLPAVLSAAAVGEGVAGATLPPAVVVASSRAAVLLAAGQPLAEGAVSTQVLSLAQEVIKSMFLTKLKVGTAVVLGMGLLLAAAGGSVVPGVAAQETKSPPVEKATAKPAAQADSDEDFIKRISKDLRGTDPTPAEVYFFVASKEPKKRDKLVDLFVKDRETKKQADAQSLLQLQHWNLMHSYSGLGWNNGLPMSNTLGLNYGLPSTTYPGLPTYPYGSVFPNAVPNYGVPLTTVPESPPVAIGDLKTHFKVVGVKEEEAVTGGSHVVLRLEAVHPVDPSQFNKKYKVALFDKDNTVLTVQDADFGPSLRLEKGEVIRIVCPLGAFGKRPEWKRLVLRPVEAAPDSNKGKN